VTTPLPTRQTKPTKKTSSAKSSTKRKGAKPAPVEVAAPPAPEPPAPKPRSDTNHANGEASRPNIPRFERKVPGPSPVSFANAPKVGGDRLDPLRAIRVRGAREHNLKNIDVDIPRDRHIVVTGLSGSGKSSLAFDTIYAEGQRKYMESLSAYARQFLDRMQKPAIDDIEGLPPTIAIEQRTSGHNPRSTVATSTEIYDYLRLLFARVGRATCWEPTKLGKNGEVLERCGNPIRATSASQIVDAVASLPEGSRLMLLAPVVRAKKGFHREVLESLQSQGFVRARVNGAIVDLREALKEAGDNPLNLGRYEKHTIEAIVDRVVVNAESRQRIADSIETSLRIGEGAAIVSREERDEKDQSIWTDTVYSEKHACSIHPHCALEELEPRLFSFNSPFGACPSCDGLGTVLEFDEATVMPDDSLSLSEGAIEVWAKAGPVRVWFSRKLKKFCKAFGVSYTSPVSAMDPEKRRILLHGVSGADAKKHGAKFEGVIPITADWWKSTESPNIKEWLSRFMSSSPCATCRGDRLKIEALSVFVRASETLPDEAMTKRAAHGLSRDAHLFNIADFTSLTIDDAVRIVGSMRLSEEQLAIAEPIMKEIRNRLGFMQGVGLEYLSLDRKTATLSGGEAQRIRLATQVGSGLVGACYVLDEPTIGLHQRDNDRLIATLRHLADIGNTVIVVEHDEDMIRSADHILDVGPGPGVHGGRIVAQGTLQDIATSGTLTGKYLSGEMRIDIPEKRRTLSEKKAIVVKGAKQNNLKSIDAAFPLGGIVCVTGVSGSGKSTLVNDILLQAAKSKLGLGRARPGDHKSVTGLTKIDRVVEVDQTPIGRTPRSNPATYTGMFDDIRKIFAKTKEARIRGYQPGRFSFNVKGGRCEACAGHGLKKIEMHFLPDVFVPCEVCKGARYNRETLEVHYRGKTIADVLNLTVEDACSFFENMPKILRYAQCLNDVGLGYVTLGQPSTTLSGGEAQRIKLAAELGGGAAANTLYILDEPTTGLHFEDVRKLCAVLDRLADAGATLVVIEHNLDVIKRADWIVDLGPEGGDKGGTVVATGTPEDIARAKGSYTGQYLKPMLANAK
jgi:excinuclease ABC subunit A